MESTPARPDTPRVHWHRWSSNEDSLTARDLPLHSHLLSIDLLRGRCVAQPRGGLLRSRARGGRARATEQRLTRLRLSSYCCHHEVDEGPHLRRRQVTRGIQRMEREPLVGPVREQVDELAVVQQFLDPQRLDLRHADTGETRAEDRADVGEEEPPRRRHLDQLSSALELPRKGLP